MTLDWSRLSRILRLFRAAPLDESKLTARPTRQSRFTQSKGAIQGPRLDFTRAGEKESGENNNNNKR